MSTTITPSRSLSWRVVDIVVMAILSVGVGAIFLLWNQIGGWSYRIVENLAPGFGGLIIGVWLIGGVLGGLIIRKPGAALLVETLAACMSAMLGSQWGIATIYSGLAQGFGAELAFLATRYRSFKLPTALLAGALAGVGTWTLDLLTSGNLAKSAMFNINYLWTLVVSGAILAGLLGWMLMRALARTGALDRFAAGREARGDVA